MKRAITAVCLLSFALYAPAASAVAAGAVDADAITGVWETEDSEKGYAHVKVERRGETYAGTIVWLSQPVYPPGDEKGMEGMTKVDRENPDPALRRRPIIGLGMMDGFTYRGKDEWKGGTIYAADNGKTYKCKLKLRDDGTLKVRGYIGISLLGRTQVWRRPAAGEGGE